MKRLKIFFFLLSLALADRVEDATFLMSGIESHRESDPQTELRSENLIIEAIGSASASYSTGLDEPTALALADIARSSAGDKYALMGSLKEGGRVLTIEAERLVSSLVKASTQHREVTLDGITVDLSSAVVESKRPEVILTPHKGARLVLGEDSTSVKWDGHKIRISIGPGMTQAQANQAYENFDKLLAYKVSNVTGLPVEVVEFITSGRNRIIDHLLREVSPLNQVTTSPKDHIVRNTSDGWLRITLPTAGKIASEYSTGLKKGTVTTLVDSLHRAITLRISLISWSNQLMGSVPDELEKSVKEVASSQQMRVITVDGRPVDLDKAPILESSEDFTILYIDTNNNITLKGTTEVELKGRGRLEVAYSPGLSAGQVIYLADWLRSLLPAALPRTIPIMNHPLVAEMFGQRNDGWTVGRLARGLQPKSTLDGVEIDLSNATIERTSAATVFSLSTSTKFTSFDDGEVIFSSLGRLNVSRSVGLSWKFLRQISSSLELFNNSRTQINKGKELARMENDIRGLIQKRTLIINGEILDLDFSTITSASKHATTYQPHPYIQVTVSREGEIEIKGSKQDVIEVNVGRGITAWQAELLTARLYRLAGQNFNRRKSTYQNFLDETSEKGKVLVTLINNVKPYLNLSVDGSAVKQLPTDTIMKDFIIGDNVKLDMGDDGSVSVTVKNGSKVDLTVSSGLSLRTARSLNSHLQKLLASPTDVLHTMIGSLKESRAKKVKDFLSSLKQKIHVSVDGVEEQASAFIRYSNGRKKLIITGRLNHEVKVNVSPGLSHEDALQLRENIVRVFRATLAKNTGIPLPALEWLSMIRQRLVEWISEALGANGSSATLTEPGEGNVIPPSPTPTRISYLIDAVLNALGVSSRLRHKHPFLEITTNVEAALKAVTSNVTVLINGKLISANFLPPGLSVTPFPSGFHIFSQLNSTVQVTASPGLAPGRVKAVTSMIKEILGPSATKMKFIANLHRLVLELSLRGKLSKWRSAAQALAPRERLLVDGLPAMGQPAVVVERPTSAVVIAAEEGEIEAEAAPGLVVILRRGLEKARDAAGRSLAPLIEAIGLLIDGKFSQLLTFTTAPAINALNNLMEGKVNRTVLEDVASTMSQERRVVLCGQEVLVGSYYAKNVGAANEGTCEARIEPLEAGVAVLGRRKCPASVILSDGLAPSQVEALLSFSKASDSFGFRNKVFELADVINTELEGLSKGVEAKSEAWIDGKPMKLDSLNETIRLEAYAKEIRLITSPGLGWHLVTFLAQPQAGVTMSYVRSILDGRWEDVLSHLEQRIDVLVDGQPWPAEVDESGIIVISSQRAANITVSVGPGLPKNQVEALTKSIRLLVEKASVIRALVTLVDQLVPPKYINMIANLDKYLPFMSFLNI